MSCFERKALFFDAAPSMPRSIVFHVQHLVGILHPASSWPASCVFTIFCDSRFVYPTTETSNAIVPYNFHIHHPPSSVFDISCAPQFHHPTPYKPYVCHTHPPPAPSSQGNLPHALRNVKNVSWRSSRLHTRCWSTSAMPPTKKCTPSALPLTTWQPRRR